MAVEATYTKDIHYSGIITVDGETVVSMDANMDAKHPDVPIVNRYINNGRKYRANKKDIDDVVDHHQLVFRHAGAGGNLFRHHEKIGRTGRG